MAPNPGQEAIQGEPIQAEAIQAEAISPVRVQRPWGWFETLGQGEGYLIKRLQIHRGCRISLQRHHHRCEHWVVVAGDGELQLGGRAIPASPGTGLFIPQGAVHRASAGQSDLLIVEVQRGALLREDDIERLADDFGRIGAEG
jgi:mannose-6-phosphate isomerase-like protein (cupin superfamily)